MCKIKFVLIVVACCLFVSLQACDTNEPKKTATVTEVPKQPKSFSETSFYEIIPVADGGAYAVSGRSIWYLRGAEAIKVKETSQIGKQAISQLQIKKEKALWAMLQHERAKRKNAEATIEDVENFDDSYAEPDEQFVR
jgi:hypothetical protein